MPREKENMELTDIKAKRRRENNECGEKCTREDGRRDSKTEWRKKQRRYKKAYFVTERERRCENVMEKEDGAQGNYEPRKDFSAKRDNNTRMIERELRKERRSSKDKTRSD